MEASPDEISRWQELHKRGEVPLSALPTQPLDLIRAVEDPACRRGLDILLRVLIATNTSEAHEAIGRWAESSDTELAELAFRNLGGVPIPEWSENILNRIAQTTGHQRRYEAMITLNSLARHRPLFESAVNDSDPDVRMAGYSSFAIHGKLPHLIRLADGLNDRSPDVRAHVIDLFLEEIYGSDVDERPPLLERRWGKSELPAFNQLRQKITERFRELVRSESGEAKKNAEQALKELEPQGR